MKFNFPKIALVAVVAACAVLCGCKTDGVSSDNGASASWQRSEQFEGGGSGLQPMPFIWNQN